MITCTIAGRVGSDAIVRDVNGQKAIAFSVAHSETWTNAQGVKQEKTVWVNCTIWRTEGKTRIAEYIKKGTAVTVIGDVSANAYMTRENKPAASLELRVDKIELQSPSQKADSGSSVPEYAPPVDINSAPDDDDLPF